MKQNLKLIGFISRQSKIKYIIGVDCSVFTGDLFVYKKGKGRRIPMNVFKPLYKVSLN